MKSSQTSSVLETKKEIENQLQYWRELLAHYQDARLDKLPTDSLSAMICRIVIDELEKCLRNVKFFDERIKGEIEKVRDKIKFHRSNEKTAKGYSNTNEEHFQRSMAKNLEWALKILGFEEEIKTGD